MNITVEADERYFQLISGQVNRACVTEKDRLGFDSPLGQTKDNKNRYA